MRRLVGVALKTPCGWWLSRSGCENYRSFRMILPTRTLAVEKVRAIGGAWRPVAIYWTRKAAK